MNKKNINYIGLKGDLVTLIKGRVVKGQRGINTTVSAQLPLTGLPTMVSSAPQNIQSTTTQQESTNLIDQDILKNLDALAIDSKAHYIQMNSTANKLKELQQRGLEGSNEYRELASELNYLTSYNYLEELEETKTEYEKLRDNSENKMQSYAYDGNYAIVKDIETGEVKKFNNAQLLNMDNTKYQQMVVSDLFRERKEALPMNNGIIRDVNKYSSITGLNDKIAKAVDDQIGNVNEVQRTAIGDISNLIDQNIGVNVLGEVTKTTTAGDKVEGIDPATQKVTKQFNDFVTRYHRDLSKGERAQLYITALNRVKSSDKVAKLEKDTDGNYTEASLREIDKLTQAEEYNVIAKAASMALDPRVTSITKLAGLTPSMRTSLGIGKGDLTDANPIHRGMMSGITTSNYLKGDGEMGTYTGYTAQYESVPNYGVNEKGDLEVSTLTQNKIIGPLLEQAFMTNEPVYVGKLELKSPSDQTSDSDMGSPNNFIMPSKYTNFTVGPELFIKEGNKQIPLSMYDKTEDVFSPFLKKQEQLKAEADSHNKTVSSTGQIKDIDWINSELVNSKEYKDLQKKYDIEMKTVIRADAAGVVDLPLWGEKSTISEYGFTTPSSEVESLLDGFSPVSDQGWVDAIDRVRGTLIIPVTQKQIDLMPIDTGTGTKAIETSVPGGINTLSNIDKQSQSAFTANQAYQDLLANQ